MLFLQRFEHPRTGGARSLLRVGDGRPSERGRYDGCQPKGRVMSTSYSMVTTVRKVRRTGKT